MNFALKITSAAHLYIALWRASGPEIVILEMYYFIHYTCYEYPLIKNNNCKENNSRPLKQIVKTFKQTIVLLCGPVL